MRFKLPRDRTMISTCGLAIGFRADQFQLVPPAMYAEVIAAGGIAEEEFTEAEKPKADMTAAEREAMLFMAFETILLRADTTEFTGGGAPHNAVVARETGFSVSAKERDAAWLKFQARDPS